MLPEVSHPDNGDSKLGHGFLPTNPAYQGCYPEALSTRWP